MKRLFLILSLLIVGNIQTKSVAEMVKELQKASSQPKIKPPLPHKPAGLNALVKKIKPPISNKTAILRQKTAVALAKNKSAKKTPPPVKPKTWTEPRNLAIFLNNNPMPIFSCDPIFNEFFYSLLVPSNYSIVASPQFIKELLNYYRLLQELLDPKLTSARIQEIYQDFPEPDKRSLQHLKINPPNGFVQGNEVDYILNMMVMYMKQKSNKDDFTRSYFDPKPSFDSWMIHKTPKGLYVLTPTHLPSHGFSIGTINKPQTLSSFIKQFYLNSQRDYPSVSSEDFLLEMKTLIKETPQNLREHRQTLNVFISGHGSKNDTVAGLLLDTFKSFTQFLAYANTASLFYTTCYGTGKNFEYTFDTELPYIVIAHGIGETQTHIQLTTFLPEYFETINNNPIDALHLFLHEKDKYDNPLKYAQNNYQIRLPHTNWFTLAQLNKNVQIIGKTKALTAVLNKKPIVLSGKPCALFTKAIPPLKIPADTQLPLFLFLDLSEKEYAFESITLEKEYKTTQEIFQALDQMFECNKATEYDITNMVYIKSIVTKDKTLLDIILEPNFIYAEEENNTGQYWNFTRDNEQYLTKVDIGTIYKSAKKDFLSNRDKTLYELAQQAETFRRLEEKRSHTPDSLFARLKHWIETESFTNELERTANEALKSLSGLEQMVIKSVIEAKKANL